MRVTIHDILQAGFTLIETEQYNSSKGSVVVLSSRSCQNREFYLFLSAMVRWTLNWVSF